MIFEVDKKCIFINNKTFGFLEHIVLDGKNRHEFANRIFGSDHDWLQVYDKVLEKIYDLIQLYLYNQAKQNWPKFWTEYGIFNYEGNEAKENAAGILYSYGAITQLSYYMPKNKTITAKVYDDQMNGSKLYTPIAKEFYIQFDLKRKNILRRLFNNKWDSFLEINSDKVSKINGELTNFSIVIDDYILFCSEQMLVKR